MSAILWVVLYVESWKRTQAKIASLWYCNEFKDDKMERFEFKYLADIDIKNKSIKK